MSLFDAIIQTCTIPLNNSNPLSNVYVVTYILYKGIMDFLKVAH